MAESTEETSTGQGKEETVQALFEDRMIAEYLTKHEPEFVALRALKKEGWANVEGDKEFQEGRRKADNAGPQEREIFFRMTKAIGNEMNQSTNIFQIDQPSPRALDLCMAPGGFSASFLKRFPTANVDAITLSPEDGGYPVIAKHPHLSLIYADITLYAADFGVTKIPANHPDAALFSSDRPYRDCCYDLIFCGGAVLRAQSRSEYRSFGENTRLTLSQLLFALQRINPGGTLVLLLHRLEAWDTVSILRAFNQFSEIKLFKPHRAHAVKSTFYLVAQRVQSDSVDAIQAVSKWKTDWYEWTFGARGQAGPVLPQGGSGDGSEAAEVLEEFGGHLIKLGRPIWRTQAKALRRLNFIGPKEDGHALKRDQSNSRASN